MSVLAQSGGVGLSYLGFLAEENIGVNKFVSMGNKLNVDENRVTSSAYHIQSVPTLLFFKNGQLVNRLLGGYASDEIEKQLLAIM